MNFPFMATDAFYPGFQRLRVFEDSALRRSILAVMILAVLTVPVYLALPTRYNETIMIVRDLVALIPAAFWLCGGVSRRARLLYALFCALFCAGFIPLRFGAPAAFWGILAAAAAVFALAAREAPHVMEQLGLSVKTPPAREAATTFLLTATLLIVAYMGTALIMPQWMPEASFQVLSARTYVLMACVGLLHYGALYGVMYGILFRRLLTMRFTLSVPILVNSVLLIMTWIPDALDNNRPLLAFVVLAFTGSGIQFFLGMGFYFCRTTRVVLFAHVVYYMYYKSIFLGG